MIIAGDVGGTKARIGLFERRAGKVEMAISEQYVSGEHPSLEAIISAFLEKHSAAITSRLEAACFGLPGPVVNGRIKVTNLPWEVVQSDVGSTLGLTKIKLVNDLVSTAAAIPHFESSSLHTIYEGRGSVDRGGSCVVVAPGTGMGHSLIHREAGWSVLLPSEGGHANFAPSTKLEIELLEYLQTKISHVSVESVLCGPGIVNIYNFLRDTGRGEEPAELRGHDPSVNVTATVTKHALEGTSDICVQALDIFCGMLGAHCSNVVLSWLATGGVFLGGGIPPKIASLLERGSFLEGYMRKGKQKERVEATPVFIIKDDYAALYGAAAIASTI
jgi:glucokinase